MPDWYCLFSVIGIPLWVLVMVTKSWMGRRGDRAELAALICPDCEQALGAATVAKAVREDDLEGEGPWELTCVHCGLRLGAWRTHDPPLPPDEVSWPGPKATGPLTLWRDDKAGWGEFPAWTHHPDDDFKAFVLMEQLARLPTHPLHRRPFRIVGRLKSNTNDLILRLSDDKTYAYLRQSSELEVDHNLLPCKLFATQEELDDFIFVRQHLETTDPAQ